MNSNNCEAFLEFVRNVRGQDATFFGTLFTVLAGILLAAILAAFFANRGDEKVKLCKDWREILRLSFYILHVAFIMAGIVCYWGMLKKVRNKHYARRNFGIKWIADPNNKEIFEKENAAVLTQKFCEAYDNNEEELEKSIHVELHTWGYTALGLWIVAAFCLIFVKVIKQ